MELLFWKAPREREGLTARKKGVVEATNMCMELLQVPAWSLSQLVGVILSTVSHQIP